MRWIALILLIFWPIASSRAADPPADQPKPRIAFFPLSGDAKEELRERCGFSLRQKLNRTSQYEVIDGPKMFEIAAEAKDPITYATPADAVIELGKLADAQILVWGEMTNTDRGAQLRLQILDLRQKDSKPRSIEKLIKEPTDLRFASEEILQTLPGVKPFEHPSEVAVVNDAMAEELWKKNPNLVKNGDFSAAGAWDAIYQSEKYAVAISPSLPAIDKVNIYQMPAEKGAKPNNVLAMNLSRACAENNGLACLSNAIPIKPETRYRLSFRYKSDGPTLHVFVKGYTQGEGITGKKAEREIYRRQVPPSGATKGEWVTIVDDLNPQHSAFEVQYLRIDLYAYLSPGQVLFDDVVLKAVGPQTHKAKDAAIKPPATRPIGAK